MNAIICVADGSEEIEVITTINILKRANIDTMIVNVNKNPSLIVKGAYNIKFISTHHIYNISNKIKFCTLFLPGGIKGIENFKKSNHLINIINYSLRKKKLIAAICAAPIMIYQIITQNNKDNLSKKIKITCYPKLKNNLPENVWINKKIVFDKHINLLTSQGPGTSMLFALKITELLCGKKKSQSLSKQLIFNK